ncbi:unnamed protein product [Leptidea sinapis]|uniref:Uncharacterized protein n=1 Tax=Leptidea sinapis TaxID=189913 RepID=A0A5E4Q6Q1_9NEOP|nr:unnamed protein product [Leptidea sinapis]
MNFSKIFFFVFACFLALTSASPKWKIFKKIEHMGQNIRDGIIKAGPAEHMGRNVRDGIIKSGPAIQVVGQASSIYKQG